MSATARVRSWPVASLWVLAAGYWLWLIWACAGEWNRSEDYGYGWFVPPLALYFLWKRFEQASPWGAGAGGPGWWMACIVLAVSPLLVGPLELVRLTPIHWRPVLWGIGVLAFLNTLAVARIAGGRASVGVVLFPAFFMLLGIPWPTFAENQISFPLMQVVAESAVGLVRLAGLPATSAGTTITLPNCTVGVEEACSGLRSLQTALMVGVAAGELARLALSWRLVLLGVAFGMALAANQMRVLLLVLAGVRGGSSAVESFHDAAGYLVLAVLLVGVGVAAALAARWQRPAAAGGSTPGAGGADEVRSFPKVWVLVPALAIAAMFAAHLWFRVNEDSADRPSSAILRPVQRDGLIVDSEVPEAILDVLNPDEYSYLREFTGGSVPRVIGYHFYWSPRAGNANQLYHRPDRCMPGAGWRIDGEVKRQAIPLGGKEVTFNLFPLRGPGGRALMLWGAFLNGEPVQIAFDSDVYLGTANLLHFIRTGTRMHSYEVAAFIMPFPQGRRPTEGEISAFANRIFAPAEGGG